MKLIDVGHVYKFALKLYINTSAALVKLGVVSTVN
jgi:hypothetical protein